MVVETNLSTLEVVSLVLPASVTFSSAGYLEPGDLRSLDAFHLATAREMEDDLSAATASDQRLAAACAHHATSVLWPA